MTRKDLAQRDRGELGESEAGELRGRQKFADSIIVEPYEHVQEFLDEAVAATAREAADDIIKLFEPLGKPGG